MSVRFVGAYQKMGPVTVDTSAVIARGDFVQINAAGAAEAVAAGDNTHLAVALDKYPDTEYEGTKSRIEIARLGEDCEIEVPLWTSSTVSAAVVGGGPFAITAAGEVNVDVTTNGVFSVLRTSRDTEFGAATGYLVCVVSDAASH